MKILLLTISIIFLSGCATNISFDGFEYNSYISLKELADSTYELCGTTNVDKNILELKHNIDHLDIYETNKIYRPFVSKISNEMELMINSLYENNKTSRISKTYCELKIKSISKTSELIYKTLGKL